MPRMMAGSRRLMAAAARWPVGVGLTSWHYMWRTTPMGRREMSTSEAEVPPPAVPVAHRHGAQLTDSGVGPLYHRRYRVRISDAQMSAAQVMTLVQSDPNHAAPNEFARFEKVHGRQREMHLGDEFIIHMPGPWDGPVRAVDVTPTSFRFATLRRHLEAGQIEFRACEDGGDLLFEIESWARSGDALSRLLYDKVRMAKEIQLHMWTSFLEHVVRLCHGTRRGQVTIETRRVDVDG
jgi:hypothetical protein